MNREQLTREALVRTELHVLVWRTLSKVRRGETLQVSGTYTNLVNHLHKRAHDLRDAQLADVKSIEDWLALAMYAEDRPKFIRLCKQAKSERNRVYIQSEHWLKRIIDHDTSKLGDQLT